MSALVLTNLAKNRFLQSIKEGNTFKIGLFMNDLTPTVDTTLVNLTAATFNGYPNTPTPVVFDTPGISVASGKSKIQAAPITFTRSGGGASQTIYGYYIYNSDVLGDTLLWVERFDTPQVMAANNDKITVTPTFTFTGE